MSVTVHTPSTRSACAALALCTALGATLLSPSPALAQSTVHEASLISGLSLAMPVAMSIAAPAISAAGASHLTVTAIQLATDGTVWVLENAALGISTTIRFTGEAIHSVGVGAGMVLRTATTAAGIVLYDGSRAVVLLPNQIGRTLSHHQRLSW